MNYMTNLLREHVPQETRIHYVITSGGAAPNVVPDFAEVYYYVRHPNAEVLSGIWDRVMDAASGAARFVIFGILSVNMVFAPMIAELYAQHRMAELQKLVTLAARGIFAFSLVIGVFLAILGEWLLGLFGPAFTAAYPALLILIVGMLVNSFVGPVGFLMMMTGHHREAALVLAVAALLQIVMNAILIPRYGLIGAATATAATVALWNIVLALRAARKLGINSAALSVKSKATRQHYISRSQ